MKTNTIESKEANNDARPATRIVACVNFSPLPPEKLPVVIVYVSVGCKSACDNAFGHRYRLQAAVRSSVVGFAETHDGEPHTG